MWMDTPQRQSLEQTGEHEETTSDPRNGATEMRRKGSALLLSSLRLNAAQGSQCTHFMILGARRKNGVSVGPSKPFWFIPLRETEQRGRKHL